MSVVAIEVDGQDMTNRVLFSSARFNSQVNATAGDFYIRLRDPDRTLAFPTGCAVVCRIDGDVAWRGFMFQWERTYVFPALDVDAFGETRFFDMRGSDLNILFNKRFVFNQSTPTEVQGKLYPPHTDDDVMIADLVADYLDLSGDGIDTSTFVDNVGESTVDQEGRAWQAGDSWGQAMSSIANLPAAIFYLQPTNSGGQLVYCDVDTPNAPYAMSDVASGGGDSTTTTLTDDFNRTVGSGWGTGGIATWLFLTGSGSVSSGQGNAVTVANQASQSFLWPVGFSDATSLRYRIGFTWPSVLDAASQFEIDFADSTAGVPDFNYDNFMSVERDGTVTASWFGPTGDDIDSAPSGFTPAASEAWWAELFWDAAAGTVQAKAWPQSQSEPGYQATVSGVPFTPAEVLPDPVVWQLMFQGATVRTWHADNATFEAITGTPTNPTATYREMEILKDGTGLVNDQLAWGIGYGSNVPVFVRDQDSASQALHGLWQAGVVAFGVYKQGTINRIAASVVDGSPQNKRGHKDDAVSVQVSTYQTGFLPAQKIDFTSEVWDFNDVIPIRKMEITFEAPDSPKFALVLSHEIDTPFGLVDPFFIDYSLPQIIFDPPPPWPPPPGPPGPCSDEICGITDDFNRTVSPTTHSTGGTASGQFLGEATCGLTWAVDISDSSEISVNGSNLQFRSFQTGVIDGGSFAARLTTNVPLTSVTKSFRFRMSDLADASGGDFDIWTVQFGVASTGPSLTMRINPSGSVLSGSSIAYGFVSPGFPATDIPNDFWQKDVWYTVTIAYGTITTVSVTDGSDVFSMSTPTTDNVPVINQPFLVWTRTAQHLVTAFPDITIYVDDFDIPEINLCGLNYFDDFSRVETGGNDWGTSSSGIPWGNEGPGTGVKTVGDGYGKIEQDGTVVSSGQTGQVQSTGDAWRGDFSLTTQFYIDSIPDFNGTIWKGAFWSQVLDNGSAFQGWLAVVRDPSFSSADAFEFLPGDGSTLRVAHSWVVGNSYNVRWTKTGGDHQVRIWDEGDAEPSTWDFETTGPVFTPTSFKVFHTDNTRTLIVPIEPEAILNIWYAFINIDYVGKPCYIGPEGPVFGQPSLQMSPTGFGCETPVRVSSTTYQCSNVIVANTSRVYINGLFQRPGAAHEYTESTAASGTIVFNNPVPSGSVVLVCYFGAGPIGGGA